MSAFDVPTSRRSTTIHVSLVAGLLISVLSGCTDSGQVAESISTASLALGTEAIGLEVVGRYSSGVVDPDLGGTEIAGYDPGTRRLFSINVKGQVLEVVDVSDVSSPLRVASLPMPAGPSSTVRDGSGDPTSVAVHGGVVAVSSTAATKTDPGWVEFYDAKTLSRLAAVHVGASPDMIAFSPNGRLLLSANEGEPNADYSVDPPGSVSIVDLRHGFAKLTQNEVTTVGFDKQIPLFNTESIRLYGPNPNVTQDLEPEYLAIDPSARTAWVTLQENNAIAELDLRTKRFTRITGLGFKDHSLSGNGLDAINDGSTNIGTWPLFGMYEPDAIDSVMVQGTTYLVTANEGDAREWGNVIEEVALSSLTNLDPAIATLAKTKFGKLSVSKYGGVDLDGDGDIDRPMTFGARSFSVWTSEGEQVFDSGDQLEQITAEALPASFNSDNKTNGTTDKRSPKKGPEPEGLVVQRLFGRQYLFLGLERIGGVMVYDLTDPRAPEFVTYANPRDFAAATPDAAGDLGPEGLFVIRAEDSPTRRPLLVVSNEVSGTVTLLQISHASRCSASSVQQ